MSNEYHIFTYSSCLQVHRLEPGSEYTMDGCVTLCFTCHGSEPKSPRRSLPFRNVKIPAAIMHKVRVLAVLRNISQSALICKMLSDIVDQEYSEKVRG